MTGWRDYAACRGASPELFFPTGDTGPAVMQRVTAKAVCLSCPVRIACLAWAVRTGTGHGVWGGLDEDERRSMTLSGLDQPSPILASSFDPVSH